MKWKIEYETNKWFILATDFVTLRYENVNNRILIYKNHIIKNSFSHLQKRWWQVQWHEWQIEDDENRYEKEEKRRKKASASMILCCYAFSLIFCCCCCCLALSYLSDEWSALENETRRKCITVNTNHHQKSNWTQKKREQTSKWRSNTQPTSVYNKNSTITYSINENMLTETPHTID